MFLKKLLIKKNYLYRFLKRLIKFCVYKFNLKRIYIKHLSIFRILFFYIIIFPLDTRLNLLKAEDTKFLNKKYVKKLLKLKSFSELSSLFIKLANNGENIEENIIKAAW